VLVLAAVAASSASAKLPEWGQCRATGSGSGGKFANAGCTQQVKKVYGSYPGAYEWFPLGVSAEEADHYRTTTELVYREGEQPESDRLATFKFAGGTEIRCAGGVRESSKIPLDGANLVTGAPLMEVTECEEPVRVLENHGELGAGGNYPGTCHSFTAESNGGITTWGPFEAGKLTPEELMELEEKGEPRPTTWTGTAEFLGGKKSSTPSVGIVYKTDPAKERFYESITCEGGENSQPLAIQIGGHKGGERIAAEVTPVNTMSGAFTATLRSQTGKHALNALVNTGAYEPVAIEASMYLPTVYIGYEQRQAGFEQYPNELELKASP